MNKLYHAVSNGLSVGICALDKKHAFEILNQRMKEYGFDHASGVSIKPVGSCNWEIGNSLIYGDAE